MNLNPHIVCPEFKPRAYNKRDLAAMYFPDSAPRTAVNLLTRWVKRCPDLIEGLRRTGYHNDAKSYSRRQVELIIRYLGEPE